MKYINNIHNINNNIHIKHIYIYQHFYKQKIYDLIDVIYDYMYVTNVVKEIQ
jgi:hypothetical protein